MPTAIGLGLSPNLPNGARGTPWTPAELSSLRAWYDAELGQPKHVGYVQLDGTSGDYVFTPDSAALDALDGDIEVVMRVWCANWATGSTQTLAGRYVSSGNQRCFRFYTSGAGAIGLSGSPDGTSGALVTPSVTPTNPLPTSTWFWLRMRLDLSNGSNSVGSIDTAADTGSNYLEPVSWTANGSGTAAVISGIFTGTAPLEIGSFSNGTLERFTGRVGRMIARDGFDGTTVKDFNASDCYGDGYWHSGGYRWNLGLPKIYDRSGNNVAPATFGSGSNQPLWLSHRGYSQLYVPGATNAAPVSLSTTAFASATQLDLRIAALVPSGGNCVLLSNGGAASCWRLTSLGTGTLYFDISADGISAVPGYALSSGGDTFVLDRMYCYRVTWDSATGDTKFWGKEPGSNPLASLMSNSGWTQVGLTKTHAAGMVTNPTINLGIGIGMYGGGGTSAFEGIIAGASVGRVVDGAPVAHFDPARLPQSATYVDDVGSAGLTWSIPSVPTLGRKPVVQSPTANSASSVILLGTDDWIDVPAAAVPALDTFAAASSVTASFRRWHNPGGAGRPVFTTRSIDATTSLGFVIRMSSVAANDTFGHTTGDGAAFDGQGMDTSLGMGSRGVESTTIGNAAPFVAVALNGAAPLQDIVRTTTVSTSTGGAGRIGAFTGGSGAIDMEFEALICRDAATTDAEHGLVTAYYGGGL